MRRIWSFGVMLTLTGCVTTGGGSGAGTYTYRDVIKPHGRERGEAAEQAATRICDHGNPQEIGLPPFDACMRARGWRFTHFQPAPAPAYDSSDYSPAAAGPAASASTPAAGAAASTPASTPAMGSDHGHAHLMPSVRTPLAGRLHAASAIMIAALGGRILRSIHTLDVLRTSPVPSRPLTLLANEVASR